MRVTAIIQARMGSTRLPGKVLSDIEGDSMLAHVVRRSGGAETVDRVVVATTDRPADDPIVAECERLEAAWFRGDEQDVLRRYRQAAAAHDAQVVVRITSDCPLIDPEVIDTVVREFREHGPDYASNTIQRSWPRGLDTEVFSADALARADAEASHPHQRVHVTPYFYEHPEAFRLLPVIGPADHSQLRWTVDVAEDLALVRAVYQRLGATDRFSWHDVLDVITREPALADLNRHVRQKHRHEG